MVLAKQRLQIGKVMDHAAPDLISYLNPLWDG